MSKVNWLRTNRERFSALFRKEKLDAEMDEEMRGHIELQTKQNIEDGMSPEEARRGAVREFGGMESIKETCRDERGFSWLEDLTHDLHFAIRVLRKNPGFATIVLLTLALGIGAVSSVFNIVQAVLLTPSPYLKPQQIVLINSIRKDGAPYLNGSTAEQWLEWQKEAKSFEAMAGYNFSKAMDYLISPDRSESISGVSVTLDFFKVLGVLPEKGRAFLPSDIPSPNSATGTGTVVILGHEFWQRRFRGDPNIIGRVLKLNFGGQVTVIGVMPAGLRTLPSPSNVPRYDLDAPVDCWIPIAPERIGPMKRAVIARLRDGVRLASAQAELTALAIRQTQENPTLEGITAQIVSLPLSTHADVRRLLMPVSAAVILVFFIACGNVAGLLLVRGLRRRQEYAVRCALGARRWRLFRQALAESLVLAVGSGVLGAALAVATVRIVKVHAGVAVPRLDSITIGWPMWTFCFCAAILAAGLAGLAPAFRASQLTPAAASQGATNTTANRTDRYLVTGVVVLQMGMTVALLLGAGLMIRTVSNLAHIPAGYDTEQIVTMTVTELKQAQPPSVANDFLRHLVDFHQRAMTQLTALPGVKSVAWVLGVPLTGDQWSAVVETSDSGHAEKLKDEIIVPVRAVSPNYFDTMGMQILAGRDFGAADNYTNRNLTVIVNQAMADRYFVGSNAIGKRFRFVLRLGVQGTIHDAEIIGIAANSLEESLTKSPQPEIYLPYWHFPSAVKSLVVHTIGDPRRVLAGVEQTLRTVDPTVVLENARTLKQIRNDSIAPQLFAMRLLTGFSFMAGALALIGIYGVLALSVASRQKEMAIRLAVGAQHHKVFGLILAEGMRLAALGVAIGTAVALASSRILSALLFGVEPTDPITLSAVILLFLLVAFLACCLPACRASKIDPMTALRYE